MTDRAGVRSIAYAIEMVHPPRPHVVMYFRLKKGTSTMISSKWVFELRWPISASRMGKRANGPVLRYDRSRIHLRLLMKMSECRSDVESRKVNVKIANYRSYRCQIMVSGGKISK